MEIKIIGQRLVRPVIPTPDHLRTLKISSLDQLTDPSYVPILLHYTNDVRGNESQALQRRQQLELSLSLVLTQYYPLAGRYIHKDSTVDCGDQGIEFIETEVEGELSDLFQRARSDPGILNRFVKFGFESDDSPLIVLQVNTFKCGGIVIGLSMTHRIADGFSVSKFVETWAKASSKWLREATIPSFTVASVLPPVDMSDYKIPPSVKKGGKYVTGRYVFNSVVLSELKQRTANATSGTLPTRVDVLTAVLWKALIGARKAVKGSFRPSIMRHAVNMRGRTKLPVPDNACGNFIWQATGQFEPGATEVSWEQLVGFIMEGKRRAFQELKEVSSPGELMSMVYNGLREIREVGNKGDVDVFLVTNRCWFPYYNADFGWGKPYWVSSVEAPFEFIILMDMRSGDGIETWVSLDEKEMGVFEKDPDVIAFASKC